MGNHSIYVGGGDILCFLRLTLLWFSVVTVLCDFLCNVMRKVQQKQWQIFVGKVLGKLIRLGNQRVTIDPLFPFNSSRWFGANVIDYAVNSMHFIDNAVGKFAQKFVR